MKRKFIVGLLAVLMCFTLVGCGNDESTNGGSSNSGNNGGSEQGFKMPTLNSYDTFPSSDYWTALGLPANFTIEINEMEFSDKSSIYSLNAKDGNMFDCVVDDNQAAYKTLTDALWNAGIRGTSIDGDEATERSEIDEHDIDVSVYNAYWELNGEPMNIAVRARDNSDIITITVKYSPEN